MTTAEKSKQSPAPALKLEELPPKERAGALIKLLETPVESEPLSGAYKFGIVLITIVMIFLILVYLAMIAGIGWGILYHLTEHKTLLGGGPGSGGGGIFGLLFYLFPPLLGVVLILFMLKPLFTSPYEVSPPRTLKRNQDPLLFIFVERLCDAVGAPRPSEIRVNCDVNAYASLGQGVWGGFSNQVTLTIGLPLMAGLSLRQFGGVLAHEFGHFTQGAGMRLTYLVRFISHWFTRVVYERDIWDYRLERLTHSLDFRLGIFLHLTRGMIWVTRRILWCLMMVGHAVSGYMLRQMEYDADRYEVRYFGSNTFATTSRRIALLSVAYQQAMDDLGVFYEEDRLVDNFPQLVAHNASELTAEQVKAIREMIESQPTHWFDTHPSDAQRIANAMRNKTRGICRVHAPAAILSTQFDRLCCVVSSDFYKELLGEKFDKSLLHPFQEMTARRKDEIDSFQALHRCLQGHYSFFGYREVELKIPDVTQVSTDVIRKKLNSLRKQVLKLSKPYSAVLNKLHETDGWLLETYQAQSLKKARFTFDKELFTHNLTTASKIDSRRDKIKHQQRTIRKTMEEFDRAVQTMIELAIRALEHPDIAHRIENSASWVKELDELNQTREALNRRQGAVHELRYKYSSLSVLLSQLDQNAENRYLIETALSLMSDMTNHMDSIYSALSHVEYPFDHAQADIKLGKFLLERSPDKENPGEVYAAAERLLDRYFRLLARILGRKCVMAERVMRALEIELLPEPQEEDQLSASA
jgi:Zn-dependent protease with chaperone function